MNSSFLLQILYLLFLLPCIIFLIYVTLKFGGKHISNLSKGRIIRVIERVQLTPNTFIAVVLINNKPFVVSSGEKGLQIIMELEEEAIKPYLNKETNSKFFKDMDKLFLNKIKEKIKNEKTN